MRSVSRRQLLTVVGLTAAIALVQLWLSWPHLHRQISTDESFTYFAVNGGLDDLLGACRSDPAMSAYYSVAFLFAHVTGPSIFALRLFTFGCYVGCIALVVWIAARRPDRRAGLLTAPIALLLLGGTPIMREAVVDARAAVPAALVAVALVVAVARLLDPGRRSPPALFAAVVLVAVLAFVHPSAIGPAGLGWLACVWAVRRGSVRDRLLVVAAGVAVGLALAANMLQADSADGLVDSGLHGVRVTLGLLWGGNSLVAVATVAVVAAVLWCDGRRNAPAVLATGSALVWMVVLLCAVPFVTLFVARYLVISCVLLAAGVVALTPRKWRVPLLAVVALAGAVGDIAARDRRPGVGTRWCTVAAIVSDDIRPSDVLVFPFGSTVTPVMACLGEERSEALFHGVHTEPSLTGVDLTSPRAVWQLELDDSSLDRLVLTPPGGRVLIVRVGENEARISAFTERLRTAGATCVDDVVQDQGMTICTF